MSAYRNVIERELIKDIIKRAAYQAELYSSQISKIVEAIDSEDEIAFGAWQIGGCGCPAVKADILGPVDEDGEPYDLGDKQSKFTSIFDLAMTGFTGGALNGIIRIVD